MKNNLGFDIYIYLINISKFLNKIKSFLKISLTYFYKFTKIYLNYLKMTWTLSKFSWNSLKFVLKLLNFFCLNFLENSLTSLDLLLKINLKFLSYVRNILLIFQNIPKNF